MSSAAVQYAARSRKADVGSDGPRAEHVIDEPIALMLPNRGVTKHTLRHEHVVGRLKHPLKVRGVPLGQWELLREALQRHSPGEPSVRARHLEQAVEASGNW